MANNWTKLQFGDLLVNGTRNGIYKTKDFHGTGVKIVNMGELFAYPRLKNVEMRRVTLTERELSNFLLEPGDLLFARRSLVAEGAGKCAIVMEVGEHTTFESSIIRARPNPNKSDSLFLFYFFNSPHGKYLLDTIRRQVAVSGITGTDLVRLNIPVPPLDEQRAIAHVLGTLDDKIELNRHMNETLEAIARAIFKSWFIDFDPVRAKAEGKQPFGMDEETAALFPSEFEDSELGEIPKGWTISNLSYFADNLRRGIEPAKIAPDTPYIGLEHMPRGSISLSDWGAAETISSNKFIFRQGEILFGKLRPYFRKVGVAPIDGVCSTDIFVLKPRRPEYGEFVLMWASDQRFIDHCNAVSNGARMPRVNWKDMVSYPFVAPQDSILEKYHQIIRPMVQQIIQNIHLSRALHELRDALLPKLLSGEIRVPVEAD